MISFIKKYRTVRFIITMIVVLSLLCCMVSCTSVKKSQTIQTKTTDSSRLVIADSSRLHKKDSINVTTATEKDKTEVVIYFDTTENTNPVHPDDYLPVDSTPHKPEKKKKSIRINIDSTGSVDVDLGNHNPSRIEISKTKDKQKTDSTHLAIIDSSHLHKKDTTGVITFVKNTSNTKKKFGMPFITILAISAIFVLFMLFFIYRKAKEKTNLTG